LKVIVWAYPVTAVTIQTYNDLETDEEPVYQNNVWLDEVIPTLRELPDISRVEEIIVMGPRKYAGHVAEKIEEHFWDIPVKLGE